VNSAQIKTLNKVFADPVNGNLDWVKIEALLTGLGCKVIEGAGSSVTFVYEGRKLTLHRPHPQKAALRYRVLAAREYLARLGFEP
jgi:hypothetical protein